MIAILDLKNDLELTASGKAYVLEFQNPTNGKRVKTWVALSQSKIEAGSLWVAEWLLDPRKEGVGALIKNGYRSLSGDIVRECISEPKVSESETACITKGFFTVQDSEDKHRTFRIKTTKKGLTIIGLMVGKNNLSDYAWFGFVDGENLKFWKSARYGYENGTYTLPISRDAIQECFNAIIGKTEESGKRFADIYQNCSRCGKVLTTPNSLLLGKGPECEKLGY
jgi:hypothetical protein